MNYWLKMTRRDFVDDEEDKLTSQFYLINHPDSWRKTFLDNDPGIGPDGLPEAPITDPRQLDHWFESLAAQRGMTGAEAEAAFSGNANHFLLGHAEGQGRKV